MPDPLIEIEKINHRLVELETEKEELLNRRQHLEQQALTTTNNNYTLSTADKIQLFKRLFKGRGDIYAKRWENAKGRSGYSVACNNEWKSGICYKPKVKCGECKYQQFNPLDDQAIYAHLSGKLIAGLYPLLNDKTCHLLAIDFDKDDWQDAIKATSSACEQLNISHVLEISRSRNGAHLWIFFSTPIAAKEARQLGFCLLDKAMEIYPNLTFESYDRLFPNQDFMPEGGFGDLIALPLQYQPRQQGNSVFVDQNLQPFKDQWQFLSQVKTVMPSKIQNLLTPQNQHTMDAIPPWEQGLVVKDSAIAGCPTECTVTLANHCYLKVNGLPSVLIAQLKRVASFSNPVFFKTQALRFSTHGIPRYISCAQIEQGYLSLPRGCFDDAIDLLKKQNIEINLNDKRQEGNNLENIKFLGTLRKNQKKAVSIMLKNDVGVLHAPTAFGKTVTAVAIICKRKVNTLILTHSRQLVDQWQERLKSFLSGAEIGIISGGKKKLTGQIDVATYQSLVNKKDNTINPLVQEYGQIIIDECHHVSAPRFEMVLNEVHSKYVFGLTATPERQDGHQKIVFMLSGPVRHSIKSDHADKFELEVKVTHFHGTLNSNLIVTTERPKIADAYRWIIHDKERTLAIVKQIEEEIEKGRNPLVLSERREHAESIHKILIEAGINSVILRGAMSAKERKSAGEQLTEAQVIVATGKYIGEGFDLPRLDTLFLAMPIAWRGNLAQYAGRIHRESEGKDHVIIYDYVDMSLPMFERMFRKREKGYKAMGYKILIST